VSLLTKSATYDLSAAERDFGYAPIVTQEQGLSRLRAWVDALGGVEEWVRHAR
jgi:nucleoside-diphosphate-sugar epimerase